MGGRPTGARRTSLMRARGPTRPAWRGRMSQKSRLRAPFLTFTAALALVLSGCSTTSRHAEDPVEPVELDPRLSKIDEAGGGGAGREQIADAIGAPGGPPPWRRH